MYQNDSFFDLTPWGQAGLACISLTLFVFMMFISHRMLFKTPIVMRIFGAIVVFYVFVWASPQVYYMYYRMVIPDLPLQWVIWKLPDFGKPLKMLFFVWRDNLSAHGQGLLGWGILAAPWFKRWRAKLG